MPYCQECHAEYDFSKDELKFLEKLNLPKSRYCPQCRMRHLMIHRNEKVLYARKCDKCHKEILSVYNVSSQYIVYCPNCWYNKDWDAIEYGKDFDFNRPFFEQYFELKPKTPHLALTVDQCENSDYINQASFCKNCYILLGGYECENTFYSVDCQNTKDSSDLLNCIDVELSYDCVCCEKSYGLQHCLYCYKCTDSFYLKDCLNCTNCFGCVNLRNKNYYLFNIQVSQEEYNNFLVKFYSDEHFQKQQLEKYQQIIKQSPNRNVRQKKCENSSGDELIGCANCNNCYQLQAGENCQNCIVSVGSIKDSLDCFVTGFAELLYQVYDTGLQTSRIFFSKHVNTNVYDVYYSDQIMNAHDLFGCVNLSGKQYCILNKQYTKEEYQILFPKIVVHMKDTKEWGDFFPPSTSPFSYNETVIDEYYPLSKEAAVKHGYGWKEDIPFPKGRGNITREEISKNITQVDGSICKKIFTCQKCERNYKIIPQELVLYKKLNMPIPDLCFYCRDQARQKNRNPKILFNRQCAKCQKKIQTTYAPDRPEIVYCEECYQKEVY
ncbi:MAG: hypothetical protein A2233_03455 [Candidatus Kerfeldbacteria bacterium RIFOXYA2_FULL_38_24]|uniref:Uncharacterized protein n=1 Tax=Candidatus Kerfeldbacteria bacterium RIFOXYB2_FULL_38_14 TaxID=1798547 RepID=A0A1G2BE47_9BACT|nr:MAG: hypothetical protein A2233_03455 [Candidatus Kerfeldbacteria bacterium RIFOXYA2_FULL_38_24]OGY87491.1 MAG: hypothetical protein A2319_03950 [Candidatus Kerfeldbacteria bacterium RIFOXYB2_FULL_38_14]OGY90227.1 MAG: hypothetical protein A2458_03640 [Candidatus Kerfeldbacteria bacterium RIFOXYC2_FULL_38_9]